MTSRRDLLDRETFGPWALVTGASSGIGREFARQLAASGLDVVLSARRQAELAALAAELEAAHGVKCRAVAVDLAVPGGAETLADATRDLDVGLVVSNAGTGVPGEFLAAEPGDLDAIVHLNVVAHAGLAHHFGRRLARRGRGGILLVGALGARGGIPYMAHAAATKAYVESLGTGLHVELAPRGVRVTVLVPGPTDTPVLAQFGIDPGALPMKPIAAERSAAEALRALRANRATVVPGALVRLAHALVPASLSRRMMARMFTRGLALKAAAAEPRATSREG